MRSPNAAGEAPGDNSKVIDGIEYGKGDKIRLKLGRNRSDAIDMLINNKIATIETIYSDYEGKVYIAVTLDDDPGQEMKRELGLYLYFTPDELEHLGRNPEDLD
jgi:hypothetical protein